MDLTKLTPAPWEVVESGMAPPSPDFLRRVIQTTNEDGPHVAFCFEDSPDNAAFIALARNAFEVMMRRGWAPIRDVNGWHISGYGIQRDSIAFRQFASAQEETDPFTALVEADKWYKEHVENTGD